MRNLLIKFALFILRRCDSRLLVINHEMQEYVQDALRLCSEVENYDGKPSGEWKRMSVYSRLIKRYHGVAKKDLSLAIELALSNHAITGENR